ncbi:Tn3 family transposase [Nonomuraea sp. NPDC049141]|uniref:Tn3 family transposase n=1 Tax=Nonomuraea sp. NPDC049141 TaxID=3155500 RepID=UPI003407789F
MRLKLARDVCHGKRGTIHQAYRDGVEDQLGSLSLVLNTIVDDPLRRRRRGPSYQAEGHAIREEDITRLSPLKHRNLNLLGRYSFTASTPAAGALRPLSDADALELDEDDKGAD